MGKWKLPFGYKRQPNCHIKIPKHEKLKRMLFILTKHSVNFWGKVLFQVAK